MQNRDVEERPVNCAFGVGRLIMANRLSNFLNIHGLSMKIDTACSGSLVWPDMACRTVQSWKADATIIGTIDLYLHPDHVIDRSSVRQKNSAIELFHAFDEADDGFVKSEAVSCVIIKKLIDAIKDPDPIRAIICGTTTDWCVNSLSRLFVSPFTFIKHLTKPESLIVTENLHALRIRGLQLRLQL